VIEQMSLFEPDPKAWFRVHCFACRFHLDGDDPQAVHDGMEAHYRARHLNLLLSLTGSLR
jgi:hypothetical protein